MAGFEEEYELMPIDELFDRTCFGPSVADYRMALIAEYTTAAAAIHGQGQVNVESIVNRFRCAPLEELATGVQGMKLVAQRLGKAATNQKGE